MSFKLVREVFLGLVVIFGGSWLISTALAWMSTPNDFLVMSGIVLNFVTVVLMGASALRHRKMFKQFLSERKNKPNA